MHCLPEGGPSPHASGFCPGFSPGDCERIIIVGAGGFGREVLQWSRHAWPEHTDRIRGFLSADPRRLDGRDCPLAILGDPETFVPRPGDGLLLAIGIPSVRRRVAESLIAKGGRFLTLIHPQALVASSARIGEGTVICPYAVVSDEACVGRLVLLNYHASLGHDAVIGDFSVLSPYAALGGGAQVADDAFLGLHASVGPGVTVGMRTKLSANSCALADVPAECIVWGVPGVARPRLAPA